MQSVGRVVASSRHSASDPVHPFRAGRADVPSGVAGVGGERCSNRGVNLDYRRDLALSGHQQQQRRLHPHQVAVFRNSAADEKARPTRHGLLRPFVTRLVANGGRTARDPASTPKQHCDSHQQSTAPESRRPFWIAGAMERWQLMREDEAAARRFRCELARREVDAVARS